MVLEERKDSGGGGFFSSSQEKWPSALSGSDNEREAKELIGPIPLWNSQTDTSIANFGGESKRLGVESPWSQFTRECQRCRHPPRLDQQPF